MHPALAKLDHRPWPLPTAPWVFRQNWYDLAFIHYAVPASLLAPLVPAPLQIQEFEGTSYVGIVPFKMSGVMARGLPDVPGLSEFLEVNVRLYVECDGKPGVWFLSLDATQRLAIWGGRTFVGLPYRFAEISTSLEGDERWYRSVHAGSRTLDVRFSPVGEEYLAEPGTLDHFLTERYCLYSMIRGELCRTEVHHVPWPLRRAKGVVAENTLNPELTSGRSPIFHCSLGIDVVTWYPGIIEE